MLIPIMARWSKSGIGIRARSPIGQAQIFLSICSPIKLKTNRPARLGLEKIGPGPCLMVTCVFGQILKNLYFGPL